MRDETENDEKKEDTSPINEPPVKKKRIEPQKQCSSSDETIEMVPGPSYSTTDEKETTTTAAENSDESSVSSDEFSSNYNSSTSDSSSNEKSPPVTTTPKHTLNSDVLTSAFRKTCDTLRDLLEKRRLKEKDSNDKVED